MDRKPWQHNTCAANVEHKRILTLEHHWAYLCQLKGAWYVAKLSYLLLNVYIYFWEVGVRQDVSNNIHYQFLSWMKVASYDHWFSW